MARKKIRHQTMLTQIGNQENEKVCRLLCLWDCHSRNTRVQTASAATDVRVAEKRQQATQGPIFRSPV
jgi:hypothetical protein